MTSLRLTLDDCRQLDAQDELAVLRQRFELPDGVIYLDGNSLGPLPRDLMPRLSGVIRTEWGQGLIRSWNDAHWVTLPRRVGAKLAPLLGARPEHVVAADSTSINLHKVLHAALQRARQRGGRNRVVTERDSFPTDLYMAQALCDAHGFELDLMAPGEAVDSRLGPDLAVLLLTHVHYRTGFMHDLAGISHKVSGCGGLTVWDLAHSAGAVELNLEQAGADFAVGCGYKYLNGGPGAPAFVWVHPRHLEAEPPVPPALPGWWAHAKPFAFDTRFDPAPGIEAYLCGTPSVLALHALDCGIDTLAHPEGMAALRRKSLSLTTLFITLMDEWADTHGLAVLTPRQPESRGSQVSLTVQPGQPHEGHGSAIVRALIARGVIGDFRSGAALGQPDILRFGFAPAYLRHIDVWHAVQHLKQVMALGEWRRPQFAQRQAVT